MMSVRSLWLGITGLVAAGLLATPLRADDAGVPPEVRQALEKVEQALRDLPKYQCRFSFSYRMKMQGMENNVESEFDVRVEQPRKWAIEMKSGMFGGSSYSDGRQVAMYLPMNDSYTIDSLPDSWPEDAADAEALSAMSMLGPAGASTILMGHGLADAALDGVVSAELGEVEAIDGVDCQRIDFHQDQLEWQLWIEQGERALPRRVLLTPNLEGQMEGMPEEMREIELTIEMTLSDWDLAPEFADADFQFDPPAGAKKVDSLYEGYGGEQSLHALVGQPAPEFTLETLEGEEFALADALGEKVVMLDFWATWCGPCVEALPKVTAAAEEFADQDVVFFAVNVQEDAETIQNFLENKELATPVLLDPEGEVSELYQAQGIPQTVLIGKDKRVHVVHVGSGPGIEKLLKTQIQDLLDGKDLAAEALAAAEQASAELGESFGATEAWSVDEGAFSVEATPTGDYAYVLRPRQVVQLDAEGNQQAVFDVPGSNRILRLARLADDEPAFLTFSTWSSTLTAVDRNGETLWTYGDGIDDVAAADLDGDGVDEVVVGFNGGTGLHVLDAAGKATWKNTQLGNVWHVTAGRLLPDRDAPQVISTSAAGAVHLFDAAGEHLQDLDPPFYGNGVHFVPAAGERAALALASGSSDAGEVVAALSSAGDVLWQSPLPGVDHVDSLAASPSGDYAAAAARGGIVFVLDLATGELIAQVNAGGTVVDADFVSNGEQTLLVVAADRAVTAYKLGESDEAAEAGNEESASQDAEAE